MAGHNGKVTLKPGKSFTHQIKVKNPDGSIQVVDAENVTDPTLEEELELILNSDKLKINGDIIKKK